MNTQKKAPCTEAALNPEAPKPQNASILPPPVVWSPARDRHRIYRESAGLGMRGFLVQVLSLGAMGSELRLF